MHIILLIVLIDLFDTEEENPDEYISFIVFDPASIRIPENDILLIGDQVVDLFSQVINSEHYNSSIQDEIILNRLNRIDMMINLLKNNNGLILTKFLNKIWRRHSFFSNLGELFITKGNLNRLVPNYSFNEDIILSRSLDHEDIESEETNADESDEKNESEEAKANASE